MLPSSGTALAHASRMTEEILAVRIAILEAKMQKVDAFIANFDNALEVRFRAQAERLDERFAEVNDRFAEVHQRFAQVDRRFAEVNQNFAVVRGDIGALQKDMTIVREGIKIILQKLG